MSVRVIAMVFEAGPEDLGQHSVMLAMADNADDYGVAWPGIDLLARKSRLSERQVTRVLAALEADGWLTIQRRVRGIRRRCSEYRLNLARLRSGVSSAADGGPESRTDTVSVGEEKRKAKKGTYTPRPDTVSVGEKEDAKEVDELTLEPSRTDITLVQVVQNQIDQLHNRQGTTINTNTTPLPPVPGGDASNALGTSEGTKSTGNGEGLEMCAAIRVLRECGIADDRAVKRIAKAIGIWAAEHGDRELSLAVRIEDTAKEMVAAWRNYVEWGAFLRFRYGPKKFFTEGHWANAETWAFVPEVAERMNRAGRF